MRKLKLFDAGYDHTELLKKILAKEIKPNQSDIIELWTEFNESSKSFAGVRADLKDFGEWISGTGNFANSGPCVVTW